MPNTKKVSAPPKKEPKPVVSKEEIKEEIKEENVEEKNEENDSFTSLVNAVTLLATNVKEIQAKLKVYSKEREKQQKILNKEAAKREKARKTPSGFAKPSKISDEMCAFMKIENGSERSRTDVTRFINSYVKENNLYNPVNRRIIVPDPVLKKILRVGDNDEVSFFKLQSLLSNHFPVSKAKQLLMQNSQKVEA
jgi:chromatin remodeling complex protein RSC6